MVLAKWLSQKGIYIVGAKRTAFGSFGGSLSKLSATELAVHATKAALQDANLEVEQAAELVDAVFVGNVIGSSADAPYLARHVALQSGLSPTTSTALTINRLCGSGFETVIQGATSLLLNDSSNIVVCAGTENMSNAPMQIDGNAVRWGIPLGKGFSARDSLWDGLTDSHIKTYVFHSKNKKTNKQSHPYTAFSLQINPFFFTIIISLSKNDFSNISNSVLFFFRFGFW